MNASAAVHGSNAHPLGRVSVARPVVLHTNPDRKAAPVEGGEKREEANERRAAPLRRAAAPIATAACPHPRGNCVPPGPQWQPGRSHRRRCIG